MLCNACSAANQVLIASAGAVPRLIPLLASANVQAQEAAAGALRNLAWNGTQASSCYFVTVIHVPRVDANQAMIAAAGAVRPLIALLASPSVSVQGLAADALRNLAWNGG
jgi:hypothetical protein